MGPPTFSSVNDASSNGVFSTSPVFSSVMAVKIRSSSCDP
jgi:hypothetical protein